MALRRSAAGAPSLRRWPNWAPSPRNAHPVATPGDLAADLGHTRLYPALLTGGTLHTLPKDVTTQPARFA